MIYACLDEKRKATILGIPGSALNGVDYIEVVDAVSPSTLPTLMLHCLKAAPTNLTPSNIMLLGGESVTGLTVTSVTVAADPTVLVIQPSRPGDFSTYTLRLVNSVAQATGNPFNLTDVLQGFDPQLAETTFSFKISCGPDFDCAETPDTSPTDLPTPPPINYLVKDYGSFRTLILDRLSQLLPGWSGDSEADLGVVLAELIAYRGDLLSYQQDAIATEAYLATARSRVSLRRHALLVDYHVHDGANARAWVHLTVSGDAVASVAGDVTQSVSLDRKLTRFYTSVPGMPSTLAVGAETEEAALQAGVVAFEPMQNAVLHPEHNEMRFYTWGDTRCCLPKGAVEATLHGAYPNLQAGDVLIFQEVVGPLTGNAADADLRHRCAVRLTQVATRDAYGQPLVDPLFFEPGGAPATAKPTLVTEIQWAAADALPFPLCLSSQLSDDAGTRPLADVSMASGNVVLADHGLSLANIPLGSVPEPGLFYPPDRAGVRSPLPVRFRPALPLSPLTQAVPLPLAGSPVTPSIVQLGGTGSLSLTDANGFTCLLVQAGNPALWPQFFGMVASKNAVFPANVDLLVVYAPPGGATGVTTQVVLEAFSDLSFKATDTNFIATQVNSLSRLIRVPSTYVPPAAPPATIPSTVFMLGNTGTITLVDSSTPAVPFLTVQPTNPADWLQSFGVLSRGNQRDPTLFNLSLVYNPPGGTLGVSGPVTLERFLNLRLSGIGAAFASSSQLISAKSFAEAPDPGLSAAELMSFDPAEAVPSIWLTENTSAASGPQWLAQQDLLGCAESIRVFVVEVESDGRATLRFATPGAPGSETEGTNGMVPEPGTSFEANFRVGNGTAGNVGAGSLSQLAAGDARIVRCSNPLPAMGGTDPETNEQIRRRAPQSFLTPERSITLADYQSVAEGNAAVGQAVASLRWTGSWYSVFLAVQPRGGGALGRALQTALHGEVNRFRLAGQDLELESPQYVSLQITLAVRVDPSHFRADVQQTLLRVLGNGTLPSGRKGLFHPDNFNFGQTVYLSPIYAAARAVPGVLEVSATQFEPQGVPSTRPLLSGELKLGTLQVARLENDPSFPNHGQLTLLMQGGK